MSMGPAQKMLAPLAMLNRRTAPPLLIYMAAGASGLAVIAETFWIRERLALSPQALLALAAWLTVPWTLKMVFGHLVDTVPVLGSRRRAYVLIGALLQIVANLALAAAAADLGGPVPVEVVYVAASLCVVVGLVIQDCVADAMTTEVVERTTPCGVPRDAQQIEAELECAPWDGQDGRFELTPLAGLPEDGSHDEASVAQRRIQAPGC